MAKKKPDKRFSHMETDHLRATMIEDEETQKHWKSRICSDSVLIDLDDGSHPAFKGAQIKLEGFSILKDPAGDPVLYIKWKPEDNMILCYCTLHPDSWKEFNKLRFHAKKDGIRISTVETQIGEMKQIFLDRYNATLKTKPDIHPEMGYLDEDDGKE